MKQTIRQKISAWAAVLSLVGVVIAPAAASAVSGTDSSTVSVTVGDTISISSADTVSFAIAPTGGGALTNDSDVVTVSTNKVTGYALTLADTDATTTLVSGANTFTASAGTKTVPVALVNGTWGYALATATTGIGTNGFDASYAIETNSTTSTSKWSGVPATGSPIMIKTTATTATNDTTTVWYAAKANTSQPTGTYTDSVTYTATTN